MDNDGEHFENQFACAQRTEERRDAKQWNPESPWTEWIHEGRAFFGTGEIEKRTLVAPKDGVKTVKRHEADTFEKIFSTAKNWLIFELD